MPMRLWYLTRYHFWPLVDEEQDAPRLRVFHARSPLFDQTVGEERAIILKRGHVRIRSRLPELGLQTVEVVNPGEIVGLSQSQSAQEAEDIAEVMDEMEGYVFRPAELEERMARSPLPPSASTARSFLRIHRIEVPMSQMLFQTLETRLARVLQMLAESHPAPGNPGEQAIALKLPAWQLADLVESNRELVRLTLDRWEQKGTVSVRGGRIVLRDAEALRRVAAGA